MNFIISECVMPEAIYLLIGPGMTIADGKDSYIGVLK
jgi:hypothetical protein